jgi:hypothetical protein
MILVRADGCGVESKAAEAQQEVVKAAASVLRKCAPNSSPSVLQPLDVAYDNEHNCRFSIYKRFSCTLESWLAEHHTRTPAQISSIFKQVANILICLQQNGYVFTNIKARNFLVQSCSEKSPKLFIYDSGTLSLGMPKVASIPNRVPAGATSLKTLNLRNLNTITATLLGSLLVQTLLRPVSTTDSTSPIDSFFDCLHNHATVNPCIAGNLMPHLKRNLADGLKINDPTVKAAVSAVLSLTGYKKTSASLKQQLAKFEAAAGS